MAYLVRFYQGFYKTFHCSTYIGVSEEFTVAAVTVFAVLLVGGRRGGALLRTAVVNAVVVIVMVTVTLGVVTGPAGWRCCSGRGRGGRTVGVTMLVAAGHGKMGLVCEIEVGGVWQLHGVRQLARSGRDSAGAVGATERAVVGMEEGVVLEAMLVVWGHPLHGAGSCGERGKRALERRHRRLLAGLGQGSVYRLKVLEAGLGVHMLSGPGRSTGGQQRPTGRDSL